MQNRAEEYYIYILVFYIKFVQLLQVQTRNQYKVLTEKNNITTTE